MTFFDAVFQFAARALAALIELLPRVGEIGDGNASQGIVSAVVARLRGFTKVRYRKLQKNATRAFTILTLARLRS
jgi:hypothetical protein